MSGPRAKTKTKSGLEKGKVKTKSSCSFCLKEGHSRRSSKQCDGYIFRKRKQKTVPQAELVDSKKPKSAPTGCSSCGEFDHQRSSNFLCKNNKVSEDKRTLLCTEITPEKNRRTGTVSSNDKGVLTTQTPVSDDGRRERTASGNTTQNAKMEKTPPALTEHTGAGMSSVSSFLCM